MTFSWRSWSAFVARHHRAILIGSLVVAVLSGLSLTRLRLDMDILSMLPQGAPAFDDFKSFVSDFGQLDDLIVELDGADGATLRAFAEEFAERLTGLNTVETVHARVGGAGVWYELLRRYPFNYLSEDDYAVLAARLTPEGIRAQAAINRRILSAPFDLSGGRAVQQDPFGVIPLAASTLRGAFDDIAPQLNDGFLMSNDGTALLFFVRPTDSAFDIAFSERLMQQVRTAEAEVRRGLGGDGVRVHYTGSYVFALEDAATLKGDIARYVVLALFGVLVVFYCGYRNLRILPFVTYPLVVTTLVTFALSLVFFDQLNAVSLSFAAILYGLSIDTGIHFYTRFLEEGRIESDPIDRVCATLSGLARANVVGSATTAVAFLLLGLSCLSAVRQLGLLTAVGMVLTTIQFLALYPALAFWGASRHQSLHSLDTPRLAAIASRSARHARVVAMIFVLVGVALLVAASRVSLDVTLTHLRPRQSEATRVQEDIERKFGRRASGAVLVRRENLEDALVDTERITDQLRTYQQEGIVASVQSVASILPSEKRQRARLKRHADLPRAAAVRLMRTEIEKQGFVADRFEEAFAAFEKERDDIVRLDTPELENLDFLVDRYVRAHGGDAMVATYVEPAAGEEWPAFAARLRSDLSDLRFQIAARALLESELRDVLQDELVVFFVLSVLLNALLIGLFFRRVAVATAVLLPVIFAMTCVFAVMFFTGTALDPVNLVVIPIIFGVGVDNGGYLVARLREVGEIGIAARSAGRSLVMTSLTTMAGFGFLGISKYPPLASMGRLAGFGLLACLVFDLTLLPALLRLLSPDGSSRPVAEPARLNV